MLEVCPTLRSTGSCSDDTCPFRHDVVLCEPCQLVFEEPSLYDAHVQTKQHKNKVTGVGKTYFCPTCKKTVMGAHNWALHLRGRAHLFATERQQVPVDVDPEEVPVLPGQVLCDLCNFVVDADRWEEHIKRLGHRKKEQFVAFKTAFDDASKDQHGVSISHVEGGVDMDIVEVVDAQRGVSVDLVVKTTVPSSRLRVSQLKLASTSSLSYAASGFSVEPVGTRLPLPLQYGREARLRVVFRQTLRGRFEDRLEISFDDLVLGQRFIIVRRLKVLVGSKADYELLQPSTPYIPRKRTKRQPETDVIPGPPAPALETIRWAIPLTQAPIPRSISSVLFAGSVSDIVSQLRRTVLPAAVNKETYGRYYKALLWVEENRMEHDLQVYDINDAQLNKFNQYYYLKVPGLAEKRPSVLTGDRILVQRHDAASGKWFEGHVHIVRKDEVGLRFHGSFPTPANGQLHNVHFKLNRIPLRRQHQALDTAFVETRILCPTMQLRGSKRVTGRVLTYNRLIAENPPQLDAIRAIMYRPPGSVPFVVFGPPGTGKTITIIESIRQILRVDPTAHILACAPSNSAADLIASRLTILGKDALFRYYAPSRFKDTVPDDLLPFACVNSNGHFALPPVAVLRRFRVIVSTCVSASFAHGIGIPRGHFSHIFVDEAGQATEPEVMIAIKTMSDRATNIVLSGDPKQLGPIIRSSVARRLQLDVSYIERLMGLDVYDDDEGHGISVVKLTKNYRSHPKILRFPNERFYKSELEPCGDPKTINSFLKSPLLVSPNFPIVFHGMSGKDTREASSPSFFNVEEVLQVKAYVEALRADRRFRITDSEIGVIAPYHAQCVKIRTILRPIADGIKVGSTEEFQGQERRVMIISTVRSSRDFVEYDLKHTLGFVANPRRFNVAVTRAQALLIVVGDPNVLSLDPLWRSFLNYVHINGGWKGVPISWDPHTAVRAEGRYDAELRALGQKDMNDFTERMQALTLEGIAGSGLSDDVEEADANVDRPWREAE
ncbi:P-loop containing nucleoside triphosphate hydrolase protein [Artomyces pyxidatus]|uniref:P-loop containing nucleoside triphosphate hydrolase protein n=1 Tax=Artomyces pyxidatus TaxID=48021 RepID=A0ACB8T3K6_9AGAM|nr:P-loop containing nucleoside triphosphate hydrolase protein [Artomyces pyxidatus]